MRIRKNANISGFLYANTNLSTENSVCQLNQSPWDIITFPSSDSPSSSLHQFDNYEVCYNVNYAGNGSSIDSINHFESVATNTSGSGENDNVFRRKNDYYEVLKFKEEAKISKIEEEIKLCDKLDNNGWQCGNVVKNGNTMCDQHISELQSYDAWTTKKKPGTTGCRPPRPKKRPKTNPHEFYYYTGFGPSWGKKRGTIASSSNNNDDMGVHGEKGERFKPKMCEVRPMELDYFDDDDDNDYDDDNEVNDKNGKLDIIGKKKGRKPVKERSLKSLM